jgi:hypothetical protein
VLTVPPKVLKKPTVSEITKWETENSILVCALSTLQVLCAMEANPVNKAKPRAKNNFFMLF